VAGHTHLITDSHIQSSEGRQWHLFNPGSVGVPLDGIHQASYMLLDGDTNGWETNLSPRAV
jgi:predicted phosphodiesterase